MERVADAVHSAAQGQPCKEVTRLLPETNEVVYKDGQQETYDTLLIATGSQAMRPNWIPFLRILQMLSHNSLSNHIKEDLSCRIYT